MEKNIHFRGITYILVILSLGMGNAAWTTAKPDSSAPSPAAVDCSELIFDMLDCMSFLNNGPSDPKPSPSCCTGFETVIDADAECVCEGLKNAASMGLSVNITKAAILPSLCHVSAPSISTCNMSIAPTPSNPIPSPSTPSNPIPSPSTPSPAIPLPPTASPPKTSPPTTYPPTNNPPTSAPIASPPSGASRGANSPAAAAIAPSSPSSSSGTTISIMSIFMFSAITVVGSFSFLAVIS